MITAGYANDSSGIVPLVQTWATAGSSWATNLVALYMQSSAELTGNSIYV